MALRVHFIHAPDPLFSDYQNFGNKYMPIWAFTLASYVDEGNDFQLDLFDTRITPVESITEADVYLMSGLNQDHGHIAKVRDALAERYPEARFVIGGPIAWSFDKAGHLEKLDDFHHVVIGDGEPVIGRILEALRTDGELERVVRVPARFELGTALRMHKRLSEKYVDHYYGATVEVGRGCPFLCEFCDIRILQDNNRAHSKPPAVIVEEMDSLANLGASEFMFACDNFIGDLTWAHETTDAILEWIERTGHRPSIMTWLTINLYKDEELMAKMRRAGFDVLFIGVESFDQNSLLETAKVQNLNHQVEMTEILRRIQAFGFIVTPGLIFGFDSDSPHLFDITVDGLEESCLLTANPSMLIALPGTPLYRRMKLAGRLRDSEQHIGRFKFQSNIRYLLPKKTLVEGYIDFVQRVSHGRHQYGRLKRYFDNLEGGKFIPLAGSGYGNLLEYFRSMLRNRVALANFARRILYFSANPRNLYYSLKGLGLVAARRKTVPGGRKLFMLWLYGWTNFVMQHRKISPADFDIESVEGEISQQDILPEGYADNVVEDIPANKTRAQLRNTTTQLQQLVSRLT